MIRNATSWIEQGGDPASNGSYINKDGSVDMIPAYTAPRDDSVMTKKLVKEEILLSDNILIEEDAAGGHSHGTQVLPTAIGQILFKTIGNGNAIQIAVSKDGATWTDLHPQRFKYNVNDDSVPLADFPMQSLVGMADGHSRITHIGGRDFKFYPTKSLKSHVSVNSVGQEFRNMIVLTSAEYASLSSKDSDTIYFVKA